MSKKIKIVVVGTGFGGTYTVKNMRHFLSKNKDVEVSIVGPQNYFLFTPLLHEVATGAINSLNIVEPIRKVLAGAISNFYLGKVEKINTNQQTIRVAGNDISYDYLVLAPGSETNYYNIPGAKENSLTLKSIEDAAKIKKKVVCQVEKASHVDDRELRKKMLTFVIVGAGPTGVELAAELQELLRESFPKYYEQELINDTSVILVQRGPEILPSFLPTTRKKVLEFLTEKKIKVSLNSEAKEVGIDYINLSSGEKIPTENIIWVAGVRPTELNFDVSDIEKTPDDRIVVNHYLQLEKHPNIFVLGDNSAFKQNDKNLPALAQVAEKEAKNVAKNISLLIQNKELKPFSYKHRGSMVSVGQWMAVGEIASFTFSGHITWWLWRTLYLSKLISTRKKINVAIDWTINLFSPRDISEI